MASRGFEEMLMASSAPAICCIHRSVTLSSYPPQGRSVATVVVVLSYRGNVLNVLTAGLLARVARFMLGVGSPRKSGACSYT
jgi:hypothetical protein